MKLFFHLLALFFLYSPVCYGQPQEETVPVRKEDLKVFLTLARNEKCRNETPPQITSSPVVLLKDQEGRTYGKTDYSVSVTWCNYSLSGNGSLQVQDYQVPPDTSFSFWYPRLKLFSGLALFSSWEKGVREGGSVALTGHLFSFRGFYPFLHAGNLGIGAGVGYYLTPTLGVDLAYMYGWDQSSQPVIGVSLGLW